MEAPRAIKASFPVKVMVLKGLIRYHPTPTPRRQGAVGRVFDIDSVRFGIGYRASQRPALTFYNPNLGLPIRERRPMERPQYRSDLAVLYHPGYI